MFFATFSRSSYGIIIQALAGETKYGDSQLLGLAKGALNRKLFSASLLLGLNILTHASKVRDSHAKQDIFF